MNTEIRVTNKNDVFILIFRLGENVVHPSHLIITTPCILKPFDLKAQIPIQSNVFYNFV